MVAPRSTDEESLVRNTTVLSLGILAVCAVAFDRAGAETIKVGSLKSPTSAGVVAIAREKGYFAAENLTVEPVYFETAQPIAVAAVSHDIDIGITGLTAAFYSLAGQGAVRIVGGYTREMPTFRLTGYVVSNHAYAAGLTSFKDFPGHSAAVPVLGSPPHYSLALIAEKTGFDLKTLRIQQLQTNANQVSAVVGGQVDIGLIQATAVMPAVERKEVTLLGWVGDETPWQLGAIFANTKTTNERRDMVERFLRAYGKAGKDFDEAFAGPDRRRKDGPTAEATLALIAKAVGQPVELVRLGLGYVELRLDEKDVLHQIAWYRSQGLLKGEVDGEALIDKRYVVALPER
jgi:NitT/TauT family transport system substrate-binding protein